jgi:site-specific recombinase XerD
MDSDQIVSHDSTIVFAGDGFLGDIVPDFSLLLEEQLKQSGSLGSDNSERAYRSDVRRFNEWRAGRPVNKTLIEMYLKSLKKEKKSPNYISRSLAAIRWYIRAIKNLVYDNEEVRRLLPPERRDEIIKTADRALEAKKPKGKRPAGIGTGRYIPKYEFDALINVCTAEQSNAGIRDRSMIALAYYIGPRVHEVAGLKRSDVTTVGGPELVYEIKIIGKGDVERPYPPKLQKAAARYLQEWLDIRDRYGNPAGALFCPITRRGENTERTRNDSKGSMPRMGEHIRPRSLVEILDKRCKQAGLGKTTWHDFRRTYISDIINKADLVTAQQSVGHSNVSITAIYDRTSKEKIEAVHNERAAE